MEMNINSFPDFVRNAEIMWNMGAASVPRYARSSGLFKEIPIPQETGNTREFSEIETEEYASRKGEDDQSERAKVQQGYTKIGKLYRISKDVGISYEWRTQGKYAEIKNRLTNLGRLAENRIDLDLTHRITFGESTSYVDQDGVTVDLTVGDGKALFATDHTLKASSTTFRNILSGNAAFSQTALEAMEKMRIENSFNQFGQKMTVQDDILWSAEDPNTVNTIKIVLQSMGNTADYKNSGVINPYERKYKHVVLPRIATTANGNVDANKAKYWGVASSQLSTAYLGMHEEPHMKMPTPGSNAEEFSTDAWNFGTRAGYMIVIVSANWIALSEGDGN